VDYGVVGGGAPGRTAQGAVHRPRETAATWCTRMPMPHSGDLGAPVPLLRHGKRQEWRVRCR